MFENYARRYLASIAVASLCAACAAQQDWHWSRACATDSDFQQDRAVCLNESGASYGAINVGTVVYYENCLVALGWQKVSLGQDLECPGSTGLSSSALATSPAQSEQMEPCNKALGLAFQVYEIATKHDREWKLAGYSDDDIRCSVSHGTMLSFQEQASANAYSACKAILEQQAEWLTRNGATPEATLAPAVFLEKFWTNFEEFRAKREEWSAFLFSEEGRARCKDRRVPEMDESGSDGSP